jgi:hypothetical protein
MGWGNSHLHEFQVQKVRLDSQEEQDYELRQFNFKVGSKFTYEYDFGEGWQHSIEVEKLLNEIEFEASDMFVEGKGACPPEDCGGPGGFASILESLKNPSSDREDMAEWLGDYDPEQLPSCFRGKKSGSKKSQKKVLTPSPR